MDTFIYGIDFGTSNSAVTIWNVTTRTLVRDPRILVVNYLGIPLSGQVGRYSRENYPVLARDGPNDGLTLLADAIAPGSLTVLAPGSDHFFAEDPRIDEKTVALMKLMVDYVEGGDRCRPAS